MDHFSVFLFSLIVEVFLIIILSNHSWGLGKEIPKEEAELLN